MANPFYTPSPFVNFQYEPNRSEAQRMVDTMKEIKKERQEDEERELKLKTIQQNYEMGTMKMKQAQMEMEEVQRSVAADQAATQRFNSDLAAGVPKWKAIQNSVMDAAKIEGPAAVQKFEKERIEMATKYLSVADVDPAAAAEAADLINAGLPEESHITPEQLLERKARKEAVQVKPGVFASYNPVTRQYEETMTPTGRMIQETEIENKKSIIEDREQRRALAWENLASLKEQRAAAREDRAIARQEKDEAKKQETEMRALNKQIENINRDADQIADKVIAIDKAMTFNATGQGKAQAILALLGTPTTPGETKDIEKKAGALLARMKQRYAGYVNELEGIPGAERYVNIHRNNMAILDSALASLGGTPAPTNGKKPNKFESYNK